jgi:hypothetical protein
LTAERSLTLGIIQTGFYTLSLKVLPNKPEGRTKRTTIIIKNANVFLNAIDMYALAKDSMTPKIRPPRMAPGRLFRPPRMAAAKPLRNGSKVENISGGSMKACRLVIYRTGLRQMADEFKMPRRVIHEELGVPVPAPSLPEKQKSIDEESLLKSLAEDYRVNPGLYMSREDIKESFDVDDAKLDELLLSLEKKSLVKLYRDKKGIALVKATYEGLDKANPPEYYRWFPSWVKKENIF